MFFARFFFGAKLEYSFSPFHLAALTAPKTRFKDRLPLTGWRRARMGPRGNGKSAVYVKIETIHDIVYGFEEFVVVIAEASGLARDRVREIAAEFEENTKLKNYFGDLVSDIWRKGMGEIEPNGVRVLAKSMGAQVRGIKHPVTDARPTKYILDDAEDANDALNPELRERDKRILREDIEGGGWTDGRTSFQFTGTPLHREALLPGMANNPAWDFRTYPAVISWPKNMKMWERCRQIWASAGDAEDSQDASQRRTQLAYRFYQANRKKMDEGCKVLWPDGEPFFTLMLWRWANGEAAFSKEKLLVPRDPELSTFDMSKAVRHTLHREGKYGPYIRVDPNGENRRVLLHNMRIVGFHDPAGTNTDRKRSKRSVADYAAIVTMGIETLSDGGLMGHVLHAWMERAAVSKQVSMAFELGAIWKHDLMIVERDNLSLLKDIYRSERERRKQRRLFSQIPVKSLERQTVNKEARITTLEPPITNGWITFGEGLPEPYMLQFQDHPTGDHDDGPDATEGCWRRRGGGVHGLTTI